MNRLGSKSRRRRYKSNVFQVFSMVCGKIQIKCTFMQMCVNPSTQNHARIGVWTYAAKMLLELQVSKEKTLKNDNRTRQQHACDCSCYCLCTVRIYTVEGGSVYINWLQDSITKAWSGHNDKLRAKSVRGRWLLYSQQRQKKKRKRNE